MNEKISILLASYNGETYIESQLHSLACQTRAADEVLIVDDHSSDRTVSLIRQLIRGYGFENWKVIVRPENTGYAENFIEGLKHVSGDLVFFCDQDDIWHRDKIAKMERCFQKNQEIDLLLSDSRYVYENTSQKQVNRTKELRFDRKSGKVCRRRNWPCIKGLGCTFAFRRRLIPVMQALWMPGYPHDLCAWHAAAIRGGIYLVPEALIDYRRHGGNVSGQFERSVDFRVSEITRQLAYLKKIEAYIRSEDKDAISISLREVRFQIEFYKKRADYLKEKKYILWFKMLGMLSYYDRKRNWISDFFCMASRRPE